MKAEKYLMYIVFPGVLMMHLYYLTMNHFSIAFLGGIVTGTIMNWIRLMRAGEL